jgi:hypothetical protein
MSAERDDILTLATHRSAVSHATHLTIPHNVQQSNDVRSSRKILQNLDLSLDLLLLHRFQDFDDAFLIGGDVDGFEDLIASQVSEKKRWNQERWWGLTSEYFPRPTFRTIS